MQTVNCGFQDKENLQGAAKGELKAIIKQAITPAAENKKSGLAAAFCIGWQKYR